MARRILITSALPYANGDLHIGHVMSTYLPADVYSRYCKLAGYDALYICASDEHGTPIEIAAQKAGKQPVDFVQEYHVRQRSDFEKLGISFDEFYHTNSNENTQVAQQFFAEHKKNGAIYEKEVELTFCEKDGRFLPDRFLRGTCPFCNALDQYGDSCEKCGKTFGANELVNPKCAVCGNTPIRKKSKHLFFSLSKYSDWLGKYLSEKPFPREVVNYLQRWISEGLADWDITRDGPYFGIPIPGEENKFFYVWYDAPIGYISSTLHYCNTNGKNFADYWKSKDSEIVHFIGKDIVYFHFLFWPAMLYEAGYSLPHRISVRGHATIQGEKMSKSRGNYVGLADFLSKYPADYLRFYYNSVTPNNTSDADFSWEEFGAKTNSELVGALCNYCYRVLSFTNDKFGGQIPIPSAESLQFLAEKEFAAKIEAMPSAVSSQLEQIEIKAGLDAGMAFVNDCNRYFNDRAPWKLMKGSPQDQEAAKAVMYLAAKAAYAISIHFQPFIPNYCQKIYSQLGFAGDVSAVRWGDISALMPGQKLGKPEIVYRPLEKDALAAEAAKLAKK
ncbi:MAG: methionine--tRNA ligase [Candidatus Micrarchaeia archaeon]